MTNKCLKKIIVGNRLFRNLVITGKLHLPRGGGCPCVYVLNAFLRMIKNDRITIVLKVMKKTELIEKNLVSQVIAERNALAITKSPFCVNLFYCLQTNNNVFLASILYKLKGLLADLCCRDRQLWKLSEFNTV